jgi:hypothetical protein
MGKECSRSGENKNLCRIFVGKPEGKTPLGRPRYRWDGNIKFNLGMIWSVLMWLRIGTGGGLM